MPEPIENGAVGAATPNKQASDITEKTDSVLPSKAQSDTENVVPFSSGPELNAATGRSAQSSGPGSGDSIADRTEINAPVDRSALQKLIEDTCRKAEQNRDWYDKRARAMGKVSRRLRLSAIGFGVLGGLCPLVPAILVEEIFGKSTATTISQLGFVLFALAAAAVVLDQAFGYSSSWMRSRLAELELGRLIGSFQLEVRSALACASDKLPADNAKGLLNRVTEFAANADDIVVRETQTWISEFKAGLLQVEQISRSSRKTNEANQDASKLG
jgi:SMODS and SLOG-associating 2TM effector domain 2